MKQKILLLLLLLLLLVAYQSMSIDVAETAVFAAKPVQAQLSETVFAKGTLEPLFYAEIAFQSNGVVAEIPVAQGDAVQEGDPLIHLDATDAELALQQAQTQLATAEAGLATAQTKLRMAQANVDTAQGQVSVAQAQLDLARSGPLPEEIAAAEANVAAAEARVTAAIGSRDATLDITTDAAVRAAEADVATAAADRRALERQYDTILTTCYDLPDDRQVCPYYGPVEESTRAELEAAQAAEAAAQATLDQLLAGPSAAQQAAASGVVAIAIANQDIAQAELDLLLAGATPGQIARAEVNVSEAEMGVRLAEVVVQEAEAAVSEAEAQVAAAQVAVGAAQLALDRMTLTAPFAGVIAAIDVNPGELVALGHPILTLADQSGWQIKVAEMAELDVARIAPGSEAEISFDAVLGESVAGMVTKIALKPKLSEGDPVYEVIVSLDPMLAPDLRWGMTAVLQISMTSN